MKEIFEQIKNLKILVVGDVMLDRYIIGEVSRISPEAPVPVLRVEEECSVPGGAANVALNLSSLGASVEIIGWFGKDSSGDELVEILSKSKITVDPSIRFSSAPTITKSRVTSSHQQICRVDRESETHAYKPDLEKFGSVFSQKAVEADAVIISDYGKGFLTDSLYNLLRDSSRFLSVDPKPSRPLEYKDSDLLTPNRLEALELAGLSRELRAPFPHQEVVEKIFQRFSPRKLAITLGSEGMLLAEGSKVTTKISTAAREVFDVSGAGDTVIAALTMALSVGRPFDEAAKVANAAAGVVVGKVGTSTASPEEIMGILGST